MRRRAVAVKDNAWVSVSDFCGTLNGGVLCLNRDTGRGLWLALWGAGRKKRGFHFESVELYLRVGLLRKSFSFSGAHVLLLALNVGPLI